MKEDRPVFKRRYYNDDNSYVIDRRITYPYEPEKSTVILSRLSDGYEIAVQQEHFNVCVVGNTGEWYKSSSWYYNGILIPPTKNEEHTCEKCIDAEFKGFVRGYKAAHEDMESEDSPIRTGEITEAKLLAIGFISWLIFGINHLR